MNEAVMATVRLQTRQMISDLIGAVDMKPEETTELRRQVLATYAFGMIFATGVKSGLEPEQVHTMLIATLQHSFGYNEEQSLTFAEALIDAVSGENRPTTNAIIHRGIEGEEKWSSGAIDDVRASVVEVFTALEDK